jgi:hypothetical protein
MKKSRDIVPDHALYDEIHPYLQYAVVDTNVDTVEMRV